jgi:hypothetical protein
MDAGASGHDAKVAASHCAHQIAVRLKLGADERHFERGRALGIPDEMICQAMRIGVHGTRHRYTARLMAPPAEILNGRQQSWAKHEKRAGGVVGHGMTSARLVEDLA